MFDGINPLFLFLALAAEIAGTVGGFGSSVFFVPLAAIFFPFETVLGKVALFHLSSNLSKILLFKKGVKKETLIYIGIPSVIAVIIGGIMSKYIGGSVLMVLLNVFLVLLSLLLLIYPKLKAPQTNVAKAGGGFISGFFAGLIGTGGAVRGLFLTSQGLGLETYIATSALIDFMIDFSRSIVYFFNGFFTIDVYKYLPFLIIIGIIGSYIGKRMLSLITEEQFKMITLLLILFIGAVGFITGTKMS
jgi:uncharacterized membrane protein YfcA